jgi:hypothetical protein
MSRREALFAVLLAVAFLTVMIVIPPRACAQMGCGLKPIPPLGCKYSDAVCRCDGSGCEWVWYCK